MDGSLIDILMIVSALAFYIFLIVVFILRAHGLDNLELRLVYPFSALLIPFTALWIINLINGADLGRLIASAPIVGFLVYDLWYRALTKKKPIHHPERWPIGLIVYLLLLQIGSIGVNWYAYLVSKFYGNLVLIGYFLFIGAFGYYQYRYNKRKKISSGS
ncbi:MAG TPA: hypothetical protein VMW02_02650 [Thermoplasmata archaeon]|nr:hypothetical protein [Thermoplasmata archaeon]